MGEIKSGSNLMDAAYALFNVNTQNATQKGLVTAKFRNVYRYNKTAADTTPGSGGDFTVSVGLTSTQEKITAVKYIPDAALTSANSTCATISLQWDNANGGGATTIATINTATTAGGGTGDWVAGTPISITINTNADTIASGSRLSFKRAATSTGTNVPAGTLEVITIPQ